MTKSDLIYLLTLGEMMRHPSYGIETCYSMGKGHALRLMALEEQRERGPVPYVEDRVATLMGEESVLEEKIKEAGRKRRVPRRSKCAVTQPGKA